MAGIKFILGGFTQTNICTGAWGGEKGLSGEKEILRGLDWG